MKKLIILSIISFFSCSKSIENIDFVKWSFYKKNIHSNFVIQNELISFLKSDIVLTPVESKSTESCYNALFKYGNVTSQDYDKLQMINPITHTICFAKNNSEIVKVEFGDNAIVSVIDKKIEMREDSVLQEIIRNKQDLNFFFKKY